jgi:hypothetical protein
MSQQQRHHISPKGHMKYPSVTPWKLLKDTIDPETGYPYIRVRGDCPKRPDLSIHLPPKDDPRHNWRIRLVEDLVLPNIVVRFCRGFNQNIFEQEVITLCCQKGPNLGKIVAFRKKKNFFPWPLYVFDKNC